MTSDNRNVHDPHPGRLQGRNVVRNILFGLGGVCALLFLADALYHKHPHFSAESWFGFYALFSAGACAGLVIIARFVRAVLIRDEGYYGDDD